MFKGLTITTLILSSFLSYGQTYTSYFTGNVADTLTSPSGGTCLMGGATEDDEAMKWFLQRANGGDILVLRTSGSDGYNDYMYSQLGVSVNSVETIVFNSPAASSDNYIHQKIMQAEAIWFAGGDQWNYVSYWRNSPIDSLINDGLINRTIVIGGTSAGMAILGNPYFSAQNGTVTSATALANPYHSDVTVDTTLFLNVDYMENVITDTHYDDPDRKGRHMVFLARMVQDNGTVAKGIACDEYTAVCIDENGLARIYGEYPSSDDNAYFLQVNCENIDPTPEQCQDGLPLDWNLGGTAVKVYAVKGNQSGTNTFDLTDWQTGNGGLWKHWYVNNGVLVQLNGTAPLCSVSLGESEQSSFEIYPNPGSEVLNLEFENARSRIIEVLSAEGRLLISEKTTSATMSLSTSQLKTGIYLVRETAGTRVITQSWIKSR